MAFARRGLVDDASCMRLVDVARRTCRVRFVVALSVQHVWPCVRHVRACVCVFEVRVRVLLSSVLVWGIQLMCADHVPAA
jgi:hypothetical protein